MCSCRVIFPSYKTRFQTPEFPDSAHSPMTAEGEYPSLQTPRRQLLVRGQCPRPRTLFLGKKCSCEKSPQGKGGEGGMGNWGSRGHCRRQSKCLYCLQPSSLLSWRPPCPGSLTQAGPKPIVCSLHRHEEAPKEGTVTNGSLSGVTSEETIAESSCLSVTPHCYLTHSLLSSRALHGRGQGVWG